MNGNEIAFIVEILIGATLALAILYIRSRRRARRIAKVSGDDLDYLGVIFKLPRRPRERDRGYRIRLTTYARTGDRGEA